jgi:CheY-like chemotaxis protein
MNCDSGTRGDEGRDPQAALMESILVLDDDPANLRGIGGVLRSEGYFALEASNGLQVIEDGETFGPISLFVTDMDLPRSSGTDIALRLIASKSKPPRSIHLRLHRGCGGQAVTCLTSSSFRRTV